MAIVLLRIRALMFRQDYRINRMIVWKIKNFIGGQGPYGIL